MMNHQLDYEVAVFKESEIKSKDFKNLKSR